MGPSAVLRLNNQGSFEARHYQKASRSCCWCGWPAAGDRHSQHIICAYAALLQGRQHPQETAVTQSPLAKGH